MEHCHRKTLVSATSKAKPISCLLCITSIGGDRIVAW